jgi:hypothetical protein
MRHLQVLQYKKYGAFRFECAFFYLPVMKKTCLFLFILWITLMSVKASELIDYLKLQKSVERVEIIPANPFFEETIQIFVRQPLDYKDPKTGTFLQRVFISFRGKTAPVVMITEGYASDYGKKPDYINELCTLINANQVVVEHRYFGQSWPDSLQWQYLTVDNAAGDHHEIVSLLKPFFTGKWVSTGISKGGQTALLHRVFYPDDVDLTVSYVAPMNFAVEDGRHEPYISGVSGTKADRKKVKEFQKEVLKRRDQLMPLFEKFISEKKLTFKTGLPEIYDFSVLEFSFSFWQWGHNSTEIPVLSSPDEEIFNYWMKISSPNYFSLEGYKMTGSFFVQAARELGYYGYKTRPFRKLLTIKTAKDYLARLFLPDNYHPQFDPSIVVMTQRFLNTTRVPMIFIYGRNDPWSASGVVVPKKSSILKIVQEGGSHRTRISNLNEQNKILVMGKIREAIGLTTPEMVQ